MAHLIDPEEFNNINTQLHEGTADLDFMNLPLEAKVWLNLLKGEATKAISLEITEDDFIGYFRNMRERTALSPSGHHMGQYIAMARVEDGTMWRKVTKLATLSLKGADPLPRWGKAC